MACSTDVNVLQAFHLQRQSMMMTMVIIMIGVFFWRTVQVNVNGYLSLAQLSNLYIAVPFPIASQKLIAVYYNDVGYVYGNLRQNGDVFYRLSNGSCTLLNTLVKISVIYQEQCNDS